MPDPLFRPPSAPPPPPGNAPAAPTPHAILPSKGSGVMGFLKDFITKKQTEQPQTPPSLSGLSLELTPSPLSPSPPPSSSLNTLPSTEQRLSPPVLGKKQEEKKGNLFTKIFKDSKIEGRGDSIIDTIVHKKETDQAKEKEMKKAAKEAKKTLKKPADGLAFVRFSHLFFHFTLVFIALSAVFLYAQMVDVNNTLFNWFNGPSNYASQLHEVQAQLTELQKQEAALKGEVTQFKEGFNDPNEKIVQEVVAQRSSWPEVEEQLHGAAKNLYPLNEFFAYLTYSNFNVNFETGQVSFTASLKDPSGNNFTALADFERILKAYPGDPNQKEGLKPYFTEIVDINSYSERYDANTNTYETAFSMSAKINPEAL